MQKQVLIVEDNALNSEILYEILSTQYRVLQAKNGQEALDLLQTYGDDVSLILLDVMMPVMDGYTFLDRIRNDQILSRIPVIVTTQSDSEEDELIAPRRDGLCAQALPAPGHSAPRGEPHQAV